MQQNVDLKLRHGRPERPEINQGKTSISKDAIRTEMTSQLLSNLLVGNPVHDFSRDMPERDKMFDKTIGYEGIQQTLLRSLSLRNQLYSVSPTTWTDENLVLFSSMHGTAISLLKYTFSI
jgi:hypothetical protein